MYEYDYVKGMQSICKAQIERDPPKEGDYEQDGILYCGKCHEAKRDWFDCEGTQILTTRDCKCERERKEEERKREEYQEKMRRVEHLRSKSLMDSVFTQATFKSFVRTASNEKQYNMCVKYVRNFDTMYAESQGLLFYGPVGTGKSFAAACIANNLLGRLKPVIMTSFVKLLQQTSIKDDEEDLIYRLMLPDLLIIDDLGAERNTDFALEKVYNIIDSRYRSKKPIILTTNLSLQEMKQTTDIRYARIYDRVFEMCYPIHFDGVSRRKVAAKERFDKMTKFFEGDTT